MFKMENMVTVAADSAPIQITSAISGDQDEYMLALVNPAPEGGTVAYIVNSAADANVTALEVPPQHSVIAGPFAELPFLYAARAQNISVSVGGSTESGNPFKYEKTALASGTSLGHKVFTQTFTAADFTAVAVTQEINCTGFPANVQVDFAYLELDTCFSGGGASSATIQIGDAGDPNGLMTAKSVFTGVPTTLPIFADGAERSPHAEAAFVPSVTLTSDVNVSTVTAGQCIVHIIYTEMPLDD